METMNTWRLGHRPALDGLRGIAVLLVIAAHLGKNLGYEAGGTAGVTLFFVLSGFLITSLLLEEHDRTGHVSLRAFYARRTRRLLPALTVLLAAVATVYVALGVPLRLLVSVVFYVANWTRANGYDIGLVNHTWSLAIEEQFYIVWPLVLILTVRRSRRALLWGSLVAAGASFGLRALLYDGSGRQDRIWFGTDTNAYALLAGCALALWLAGRQTKGSRPTVAAVVAAGLVAAGWYSSTFGFSIVVPLAATVAGVAMIALLYGPGPSGVFAATWLRYAGRRSYAWYLWHVPVLLVLRHQIGVDATTAAPLTIAATIVLGELSWRYVEAPFLIRKERRPIRTAVAVTAQ
jgi:peptidoglycan/LPS O-acetylase OafA/YrhL